MIKNIQMNVKTVAGYDQLNPLTIASNVGYTNTVSGLVATNTQAAIDEVAAKKGVVVSATLLASGWVGAQAPYAQTIAVQGVEESSGLIVVGFNPTIDLALQYMGEQANIICTGRATNSLTFTAYGALPTSNIGITISIIIGDLGLINTFQSSEQWDCAWATETITTSQNWTVPAGVTEVDVILVGGGGSGSGSGGNCSGGGSGYITQGIFNVIPGQVIPIIVGAGGSYSDGGVSSFGNSLLSASGGAQGGTYRGGAGFAGGGVGFTTSSSAIPTTIISGGLSSGGGDGGTIFNAPTGGFVAQRGQGTLTAMGGDVVDDTVPVGLRYWATGGGGGMNGGDGGQGYGGLSDSDSYVYANGGGAGGYGSIQIAPEAPSSGKGYGAGGGSLYYNHAGSGAQGVCVIKYRKGVIA